MNHSTSYKAFTFGVISTLALSLAFSSATGQAAAPAAAGPIVKLERVTVVGQRHVNGLPVARLPRVVIEGQSQATARRLAQARSQCEGSALC